MIEITINSDHGFLQGKVWIDGKEVKDIAGITFVANVGELTEVTLRLRPNAVVLVGTVPHLVFTGPNGETLLTPDKVPDK